LNIKSLVFWMICSGFYWPSICSAQGTYQIGVLPSVNFNKKLANNWSLNFRVEARQLAFEGDFLGNNETNLEYVLTDFSLIAAKKVGLNSRIAGGYLTRFRDDEVVHRTIQQYTIVQRMSGFRLAHRFTADQTFTFNEKPEFRFRYRLTTELPLNGQSADAKEFYLKVNNELLNSFQGKEYDLELRLVPLLGYTVTDNHKLEIGPDYRLNRFLQSEARNRFWLSINWFIEL